MTSPSVYDHFRPTDIDYRDGIYRVVGTNEETVTLLRVGAGDGRRVNSGEIVTVNCEELSGFKSAENPDGNRPLWALAASKREMGYWSVRVFIQQLAAHPLPTAVSVILVLAGSFGEDLLPFPAVVLSGMILIGSLGVAYIGSGRL